MLDTPFLAIATALACAPCGPGEYELAPCTVDQAATCWPCGVGMFCVNGSRHACGEGKWSVGGASQCETCGECGNGWLLASECNGGSDTVCAPCPKGYGCDGSESVAVCERGWFSSEGVCERCPVNYTTKDVGSGWLGDCFCKNTQADGGCHGCGDGEWFVGNVCRQCPGGFACDDGGRLQQCPVNTYSSKGRCVACETNSHSPAGAEGGCRCDVGFVKVGAVCVPCSAGTVYSNGSCSQCRAGEYCLGKTHHEPCPADKYAGAGAAMCHPCRPDSECAFGCVDAANCTCVDGFIDVRGECRRCGAGTQSVAKARCEPCEPGFECRGGSDVVECGIGTYSIGNRSSCAKCSECVEITTARCNSTHDSVCDVATYPYAVLTVRERFTTRLDADQFRVFAMVYTSSIPRTQVVKFCDSTARCVDCFQGLCPNAFHPHLMPPTYDLTFEMRSDVHRLEMNVNTFTQTQYLKQAATASMVKVTSLPFTVAGASIDSKVICPAESKWDGSDCVAASSRTWLGLGVVTVLLITLGAFGYKQQQWRWARVSQEQPVVVG